MSHVLPFIAMPDDPSVDGWVAALQRAMPDEKVIPFDKLDEGQRQTCTVAVVANPRTEDLRRLPRLRWVHSLWAGVEHLVNDCLRADITIVRLTDPQMARTMAEAVLAWTLYLHRDMPAYLRQQRECLWQPLEYVRPDDRRIGLLGLGALGEPAARRLHEAGFAVQGWSRAPHCIPGIRCHTGEAGLTALLAHTDILVCLLPLTAQTRGLLNEARLGALSPGASLINFSRGAVVDDAALRRALDGGTLRHAVLDVFSTEPLPADSWHWTHPGVTVLPHISAPTDRRTASAIVAANMAAYRRTGAIPTGIDPSRGY